MLSQKTRFFNAAVVTFFAFSSIAYPTHAQTSDVEQDLQALGIDASGLSESGDEISAIIDAVNARDPSEATPDELSKLRELASGYSSELKAVIPQIETQLNQPIPNVLTDAGITPDFVARCSGFSQAITLVEDDAQRAEILDENAYCSDTVAKAQSNLAEAKAAVQERYNTLNAQIKELEAKEDTLSAEDLERLEQLRRDRETAQEDLDDISDGERFLYVLALFYSFIEFAGGIAAVATGNPAGLISVAKGAAGMAKAIDGLQGGERTSRPPKKGKMSEGDVAGVGEAMKGDPSDRSESDIRADANYEGELIQTDDNGRLYVTAAGLGTPEARFRVYQVSDDALLLDLTPEMISNDKDLGIENFTSITRVTASEPNTEERVILVLTATTADGTTGQFLMMLRPLTSGFVLLVPND